MPVSSGPPAFVHQSFQHEILVEPCGFTAIAVVESPDGTGDAATRGSRRRIVWTDTRRGLLGVADLACPSVADPPPGRRRRSLPLRADLTWRSGGAAQAAGEQVQQRRNLRTLSSEMGNAEATASERSRARATCAPHGHDIAGEAVDTSGLRETDSVARGSTCPRRQECTHSQSRSATKCTEAGRGSGVRVLLHGVNRPSLVAVAGERSCGVFFIDGGLRDGNESAEPAPFAPLAHRGANEALNFKSPVVSSMGTRTQRLRFFGWGAEEAVTLVDEILEPVALHVSSNYDVFILESMGNSARPSGGERRWRVCALDGGQLAKWLDREVKNTAVEARRISGSNSIDVAYSSEKRLPSQNANSSGESSISRGGSSWISVNTTEAETRRERRRGVVDFAEILLLPHPTPGRARECPVGMSVLDDKTLVIAVTRSTALHEGAALARHEGALRAFPVAGASVAVRVPVSPGADTVGVDKRAGCRAIAGYDADSGWLVAEGLPVISGIASSRGSAIYLSLCGSSRDGTVAAVISLRATRRPAERLAFEGDESVGGASTPSKSRGLSLATSRRCRDSRFTEIVSGYGAAVAVDEKMNVFYTTAQRRSSCRALWCGMPGAGLRRVSTFREVAPVLSIGSESRTVGGALRRKTDGKRGGRQRGKARAVTGSPTVKAEAQASWSDFASLSAALLEEECAIATARDADSGLFSSRQMDDNNLSRSTKGRAEVEDEGRVNIAVVARCRPLLEREARRGVRAAVSCELNEVVIPRKELPLGRGRRFSFDRVFGPTCSQARVYAETVAPVVAKLLDGYNCSVLAYGQTSSGKTFTMNGGLSGHASTTDAGKHACASKSEPVALTAATLGIFPRAVHAIFRDGHAGGSRRFWVYVSHVEVYNERLFDLLAPASAPSEELSSPRSPRCSSLRCVKSPPRMGSLATNSLPGSPRRTSSLIVRQVSSRIAPAIGGPHASSRRAEHHGVRSPVGEEGSESRSGSPQSGAARAGSDADSVRSKGRGLTIEEDRELGVMIRGLTQVEVRTPEEIFAIISRSNRNRRTAETMCNVESSRSHGVFCVRVISAEPTPWGGEITRDGRLSLVDLSGSENIKRSGAVGARAREAAAIGQSLLTLGRVIKALVEGSPHVPYRESKLTRMLGDSLGGNTFTAMILNITPNHNMLDETLNTLAYAKMAQSVENTPTRRISENTSSDAVTIGDRGESERDAITSGVSEGTAEGRGVSSTPPAVQGVNEEHYVKPWDSLVPIRKLSSIDYATRLSAGVLRSESSGPVSETRADRGLFESRGSNETEARSRPATAGAKLDRLRDGPEGFGVRERSWRHGHAAVNGPCDSVSFQGGVTDDSGVHATVNFSAPYTHRVASTGHLGGRGLTESVPVQRVFDSTAAEWVHHEVLQPSKAALAGNGQQFGVRRGESCSTEVSLTDQARQKLEDFFHRHDCVGRGYLLASEVYALQQTWANQEMGAAQEQARHSRGESLSRNSSTRRPSANEGADVGRLEGSGQETRVLSLDAFLGFCRAAASRDAIFIRHLFASISRDERPDPRPGLNAPRAQDTRFHARTSGVDGRKERGAKARRTTRADVGLRQVQDGEKGKSSREDGIRDADHEGPRRPVDDQDRHDEDTDRPRPVGGGCVDPAELWGWTEDERDYHGQLHKHVGLLSRGGGARVMSAPPAAFPSKATSEPLVEFEVGRGCTGTAMEASSKSVRQTADANVFLGRATGPTGTLRKNTASDIEDVPDAAAQNVGCAGSGALRTGDDCASKERAHHEVPAVAVKAREIPGEAMIVDCRAAPCVPAPDEATSVPEGAICEWCLRVVDASRTIHSAAYCDDEIPRV